jgi:hypothetical protein
MLLVLSAVVNGQEQGVQKKFTANNTVISYQQKLYVPPYLFKKNDAMLNQATVLNCSQLLYATLAAGNIKGATALSNDPETVKAKYERHQQRVGADEFKKMFAGYFTGSAEARAELTVGKHTMLVIYDSVNEMFMGQMYVKDASKYIVAVTPHTDIDQLGTLLNALQDGSLKLE